jgi:dihydrofolate synthase / folylpolyglutamate synthase
LIPFSNFIDVLNYLESVPKFSHAGQAAANFNLDRMKKICSMMGNPQERFRSIHVAGTNGKGTICRMLASVYQEAGYKSALYTSPHLMNVTERFKINAIEINSDSMVRFFREYGTLLHTEKATYFEITTALAFWYFAIENVDIAILETGLGGRLDATNVVDPLASVITSVGLDHTELLGEKISDIAAEKGGIIKKNRPVFAGPVDAVSESVLKDISVDLDAPYFEFYPDQVKFEPGLITLDLGDHEICIRGDHFKSIDALNVRLALNIVTNLRHKLNVELPHFVNGIEKLIQKYPHTAVFERVHPVKRWFFDGAHNKEAILELTKHLMVRNDPEIWNVVLSFMSDKLNDHISELWRKFPNIYLYEMNAPRAARIEQMRRFFPGAKIFTPDLLNDQNQFKSELVIFSGSFYFYSTVREWMGTMTVNS